MNLIKTAAVAAAALALLASSTAAHDYIRRGNEIGQTNQWDTKLPAPFARDEFERFTQ